MKSFFKFFLIFTLLFVFLLSLAEIVTNYFKVNNLSEPINKSYASDELSFLKTFYLMEKGENYYSAFKSARLNLYKGDLLSSDTFVWRSPVVFWFWTIFANNGYQILILFILLGLGFLIAVFFVTKKITESVLLGIISVLLFVPYFYDTFVYKTAFLFTEWWGLFFYVYGLAFLIYKKNKFAIFFLTLAVISRELFIIPVFLIFLYNFFSKKDSKIFLIPLFIFFIFTFIHSVFISKVTAETTTFNVIDRFHRYSLDNLQRMVSFSMKSYVFLGMKTHYIFVFLGTISIFLGALIKKEIRYIFLSVIGFLIFLPMISTLDNDYWGIFFVTTLIMSIPFMINLPRLFKKRQGLVD